MAEFDPYHSWLGIPPEEQPVNYFRLMGIHIDEDNEDVIESAADRQMAHVRSFQSGKYSVQSQEVLNILSQARIVLLDAEKRAGYRAQLQAALNASQSATSATQGPQSTVPQIDASSSTKMLAAAKKKVVAKKIEIPGASVTPQPNSQPTPQSAPFPGAAQQAARPQPAPQAAPFPGAAQQAARPQPAPQAAPQPQTASPAVASSTPNAKAKVLAKKREQKSKTGLYAGIGVGAFLLLAIVIAIAASSGGGSTKKETQASNIVKPKESDKTNNRRPPIVNRKPPRKAPPKTTPPPRPPYAPPKTGVNNVGDSGTSVVDPADAMIGGATASPSPNPNPTPTAGDPLTNNEVGGGVTEKQPQTPPVSEPVIEEASPKTPIPAGYQERMAYITKDVYPEEFKAGRPQVEFLNKLLNDTQTIENLPSLDKYAMLQLVYESALKTEKFATALAAADKIDEEFDVNLPKLRYDIMSKASQTSGLQPEDYKVLVAGALESLNQALQEQQMAQADVFLKMTLKNAMKVRSFDGYTSAIRDAKAEVESVKAFQQLVAANYTALENGQLEPSTLSPQQASLLGGYYVTICDDWKKGLPLLASDASKELGRVAKAEITQASADPKMAKMVADKWVTYAPQMATVLGVQAQLGQGAKRNVLKHALELYKEVKIKDTMLSPIDKTGIDNTIKTIETQLQDAEANDWAMLYKNLETQTPAAQNPTTATIGAETPGDDVGEGDIGFGGFGEGEIVEPTTLPPTGTGASTGVKIMH